MRAPRTLLAAFALGCAAVAAQAQVGPQPGVQTLSARDASKLFHRVCLRTAPGFAQSPATLDANGFAQDPENGIFFHPELNLSFQLRDGRCSMVFASDEAATEMALAFAAATSLASGPDAVISLDPTSGRADLPGPAGTRMMVEPFASPSGESYFRALLAPSP